MIDVNHLNLYKSFNEEITSCCCSREKEKKIIIIIKKEVAVAVAETLFEIFPNGYKKKTKRNQNSSLNFGKKWKWTEGLRAFPVIGLLSVPLNGFAIIIQQGNKSLKNKIYKVFFFFFFTNWALAKTAKEASSSYFNRSHSQTIIIIHNTNTQGG